MVDNVAGFGVDVCLVYAGGTLLLGPGSVVFGVCCEGGIILLGWLVTH